MSEGVLYEAEAAYVRKRINFVKLGIFLGWVCGVTFALTSFYSVAGQGVICPLFESDLTTTVIIALLTVAVMEFTASLLFFAYNYFRRGIPFAEYKRVWNVKSSRMVILSSLCAGPIATGSLMAASSLCGVTYAACIVGACPIFAAIGARIFLKEKISSRVFVGIFIVVAGIVLGNYAPPEGVTNFYLGIGIAFIGALGFAAEALLSTYALDISDPIICCGLYRALSSSLMGFAIVFGISFFTGNIDTYGRVFSIIFSDYSSNMAFRYLIWGGLFTFICYGVAYYSFAYCGAARAAALMYSMPVWSIPLGLFFVSIGLFPYTVTTLGIIGAVVVVLGVMLVVAKPSELFTLRDV